MCARDTVVGTHGARARWQSFSEWSGPEWEEQRVIDKDWGIAVAVLRFPCSGILQGPLTA